MLKNFEQNLFSLLSLNVPNQYWKRAMKENILVASFKRIINENSEETEWRVFGFGWFIDGIQFHSKHPFIIDDFDKFASLSQFT
jgi:hypothetical protein